MGNGGAVDVVVVGGGLVGGALAFELCCLGMSVAVVDERHEGRATDAGAGILSPETTSSTDGAWAALALASGAHFRQLVARLRESGQAEPGYDVCGLVGLSLSEGDEPWFSEALDLARQRSPRTVSEISAGEAAELFPPLGTVRRAFHHAGAARVDGRVLNRALSEAASTGGAKLVPARARSLHFRSSRVERVITDRDEIACGQVVLAAGAWSAELGELLGVSLPVAPHKGQIVHLRLPDVDSRRWAIAQPVLSHYLVPWPGGRVAVGGTIEPEAGFDGRATAAGVSQLLREALKVAPGLGEAGFVEVRVGFRPASGDDRPVLGALPGWDNVHVATGHGANGLLMGPYSAKLVAQGMAGEKPELDLAPFSPSRFSSRGRPPA